MCGPALMRQVAMSGAGRAVASELIKRYARGGYGGQAAPAHDGGHPDGAAAPAPQAHDGHVHGGQAHHSHHGQAHDGQAARHSDAPESAAFDGDRHQETADGGPRRRGRLDRRSLFRFSALTTAGVAATAAMGGVAAADSPARSWAHGGARIADLTHELHEDFPVFYPLVPQPRLNQVRYLETDGFNANEIIFNEHAGTHIDPPGHFDEDGVTLESLPVEWLVAPLAVIRIADRAARDPETTLTVRDILAHERRHGRLPERGFVAVDAGWTSRVHRRADYLGESDDGVFRFPGISPEAAAFLVTERNIVGAGVDTSSLDGGVAEVPETHQILLPSGKYGIENLAALDTVPDRGALLVVGAPKHRGGYGGQVRALALY